MKDERGLYYHPQPGNSGIRVYVRRGENNVPEFRLWQADLPEIWERHPWLPADVLRRAARLYQAEKRGPSGGMANPLRLYDEHVAQALLDEENT